MQELMNFLRTDNYLLILSILVVLLFIGFVVLLISNMNLKNKYPSDLSFAVALLDEENSGVVFNGIYSREMSNIYAKPVEKGNSSYTLSDEEAEAINKAINSNNIYRGK